MWPPGPASLNAGIWVSDTTPSVETLRYSRCLTRYADNPPVTKNHPPRPQVRRITVTAIARGSN